MTSGAAQQVVLSIPHENAERIQLGFALSASGSVDCSCAFSSADPLAATGTSAPFDLLDFDDLLDLDDLLDFDYSEQGMQDDGAVNLDVDMDADFWQHCNDELVKFTATKVA